MKNYTEINEKICELLKELPTGQIQLNTILLLRQIDKNFTELVDEQMIIRLKKD